MTDGTKTATQMLADAASDVTADDIEKAVARAGEMFDAAPWLSRSATHIGGCANLTYADLYSLFVAVSPLRSKSQRNARYGRDDCLPSEAHCCTGEDARASVLAGAPERGAG
jgi:hypothetical protein